MKILVLSHADWTFAQALSIVSTSFELKQHNHLRIKRRSYTKVNKKIQFDSTICTCQASTRTLKSWLGTTFVFGRIAPVLGLVLWSLNHSDMLARSYLHHITVIQKTFGCSELSVGTETYVKPSAAITGSRYISMLNVLQCNVRSMKSLNWNTAGKYINSIRTSLKATRRI